jgi:prolyl-tRNA synthetase
MKIYNELDINDVLLDDRDESLGVKMKDADLLGCPYQIILGNKTQVKKRSTGIVEEFENIKTLMDFIKQ